MPWQLTTPVTTGSIDTVDYDQIRVTLLTHDSARNFIQVQWEYGRTVSGEWAPGVAPVGAETSRLIDGSEYVTLVTTHLSNDGELTYDAVKRGMYDHLNTMGDIAAGSVV